MTLILPWVESLHQSRGETVYASAGITADCSPLYRVTGPQSLAVQAAGPAVVWPLLREARDGDLSQALPGGTLIAG